jgi:hypothetical protein
MGVPNRLAAIAAFCLAATGLSTATGLSMASAATRTTSRPVVLYASPDGTGAACAVSAPCGLSGAKSRNAPGNAQDYHRVGVYEQSVALDSTATVAGVILPGVGQGGSGAALHVFGLAIG